MPAPNQPKLIPALVELVKALKNHFVKPGWIQYFHSGRSTSITDGSTGIISYTQLAYDMKVKSFSVKAMNTGSAYALINGVKVQLKVGTENIWPTEIESSFLTPDGLLFKNSDKPLIIRKGTNVSLAITNNSGATVIVDSVFEGLVKKGDYEEAV